MTSSVVFKHICLSGIAMTLIKPIDPTGRNYISQTLQNSIIIIVIIIIVIIIIIIIIMYVPENVHTPSSEAIKFNKLCHATQLRHSSDSNIVPCQTKFEKYINEF